MAFTSISSTLINVGKAVKREIFTLIKDNFDDHESRLIAVEFQQAANYIFNGDISLVGIDEYDPTVFYYKTPTALQLSDVTGQLFTKQSISSGILSFDIEKSTDTNNSNFVSCLNSDLSFNFATDAEYSSKQGDINGSTSVLNAEDILRIKFTSVPIGFNGKILIRLGAA